MAKEIYEQVVDQQGISQPGMQGGLQVIIEKLQELEIKIDEINEKIPEAKTG